MSLFALPMIRQAHQPRSAAPSPWNSHPYFLFAAAGLFVLMVAVGSIPGKAEALSAATNDKLLHLSAYFVLSVLLYAGWRGTPSNKSIFTFLAIAAMGGIDETIQSFLPYRKPEWIDWLFNMWAAALSVFICRVAQHAVRRRCTRINVDDGLL